MSEHNPAKAALTRAVNRAIAEGSPVYTEQKPWDSLNAMLAWEQGDATPAEEDKLFQYLLDTGLAWKLQGAYGRHAQRLIEAGRITPPLTKRQRAAMARADAEEDNIPG